jgi:hypothetical protein
MARDPLEELEAILSNPAAILEAASKAIGEECIGLIKDGFRNERDPYGRRWAPKQRPDGRKVLSGKTGRLKIGWKLTTVNRHEVRVTPSVSYAEPHQNPRRGPDGNLKRPKRMMVPDAARGIPPAWKREIREAAAEAIGSFFTPRHAQAIGRLTRSALPRRGPG